MSPFAHTPAAGAASLAGLAALAPLAVALGGSTGLGAAWGGTLGLGLAALATARTRTLLERAPQQALQAFVLGFLTKLLVLLAAVVFFRLSGLETPDPQAFCLAFLFGALYASAAGWLGSGATPVPGTPSFGNEALPR